MKIIDNALGSKDFDDLKSLLVGNNFPWYFSDDKVGLGNNASYNYQFTHCFFIDNTIQSNHFEDLKVFHGLLNSAALVRIKANLTTPYKKVVPFDYHVDFPWKTKGFKTAIYYLNSTDGPTLFENGETIECVENRLVIFDGNLSHTGTTHTNSKYRVLINFNYFENDSLC